MSNLQKSLVQLAAIDTTTNRAVSFGPPMERTEIPSLTEQADKANRVFQEEGESMCYAVRETPWVKPSERHTEWQLVQ